MRKRSYRNNISRVSIALWCLVALSICGCPNTEIESENLPSNQPTEKVEPVRENNILASIESDSKHKEDESDVVQKPPDMLSDEISTSTRVPFPQTSTSVTEGNIPQQSNDSAKKEHASSAEEVLPESKSEMQNSPQIRQGDSGIEQKRKIKEEELQRLIAKIESRQSLVKQQMKQAAHACHELDYHVNQAAKSVKKMMAARNALKKEEAQSACQAVLKHVAAAKSFRKSVEEYTQTVTANVTELDENIVCIHKIADSLGKGSSAESMQDKQNKIREQMQKMTESLHNVMAKNDQLEQNDKTAHVTAKLMGLSFSQNSAQTVSRRQSASSQPSLKRLDQVPEVTRSEEIKSTPEGILKAVAAVDGPVSITGTWIQTAGDSKADFLPGGYSRSILVFRADGVLEVRRTWGQAVEKIYRMSYQWQDVGRSLVLGDKTEDRPSEALLQAFRIDKLGIKGTAAVLKYPVRLKRTTKNNKTIVLSGKTYTHFE